MSNNGEGFDDLFPDPLLDFDLWFPPPRGEDGLHDPLHHLGEPAQVPNIPSGVSAPIPFSRNDVFETKDPTALSKHRGTVVEEEERFHPTFVSQSAPSLNQLTGKSSEFAPPSTSPPFEESFNIVSKKTPAMPVSSSEAMFHHDATVKNGKVANYFSAAPVSLKGGNNDANIASYPSNAANHLVPPSEYGSSPRFFPNAHGYLYNGPYTSHRLFDGAAELKAKTSMSNPSQLLQHPSDFYNWHGLAPVHSQAQAVDPYFIPHEHSYGIPYHNQPISGNNVDLARELESITPASRVEKERQNPGPSTSARAPRNNEVQEPVRFYDRRARPRGRSNRKQTSEDKSCRNSRKQNPPGASSNGKRKGELIVDDPATYALLSSPARTRSGAIYKAAVIPKAPIANKHNSILSTQAKNGVERDCDLQSPVSVQIDQRDQREIESSVDNSYLNRVYFAYVKKRAELEAEEAKSKNPRNRRKKVDKAKIKADMEKDENEEHAKKKRKIDDGFKGDELDTKQQLRISKSMSADEKRRARSERNRLSAQKSRERAQNMKIKNERLARRGRIDNETKRKAVLILKSKLEETQTRLLKKMDVDKFRKTCPTTFGMLDEVDEVIADSQWTFRPENIPLIDINYQGKSKK